MQVHVETPIKLKIKNYKLQILADTRIAMPVAPGKASPASQAAIC